MSEPVAMKSATSPVHRALRAAFVARLIRRMQQTGLLKSLFRVSFDQIALTVSPPHPCASGVHAILKPLCRSGVAAGGAGGGGPGYSGAQQLFVCAATDMPIAA